MEQFILEYFLNSIWQVLLLAGGAWLLVRALRPGPLAQHWIWLGVLPLALALPLLSLHSTAATRPIRTTAQPRTSLPVAALFPATPTPMTRVPHPSQPYREGWEGKTAGPPLFQTPVPSAVASIPTSAHRPRIREFQLSPSATCLIVGVYLATIFFAVVRLFFAWRAAHHILAPALPAQLSPADSQLLDNCCRRLRVHRPTILESATAASPMLIGILRPALLLPPGLTNQPHDSAARPSHDLEAILLHELAHLRRRDCLANLLCRIAALPIAYHPAAWAVRRRIRQSQELLCDAIAAAAMQSPINYARCLVNLAQGISTGSKPFAHIYGATMFDGKILEERVMRLIETKTAVRTPTRIVRLACGIAVMLAVLATASIFRLTPTLAQVPVATSPALVAAASSPAAIPAPTPAQAQPRSAARPAPATAAASTPQPEPTAQGAPQSTSVDYNALQIQYNYARKLWDAFVTRQVDSTTHGGEDLSADPKFRAQMDAARKQYEDASRAMEDAAVKHNAAVQQRQEALEMQAREQQRDQQTRQLQYQQLLQQYDQEFQQLNQLQTSPNDPAYKAQSEVLANLKQRLDAADMQLHNADIEATSQKLSNPVFQKAIADAAAKANSPEVAEQMARLTALEEQLAALCYQLQDQQARIGAALQNLPAPPPAAATPATKP